MITAIQRIPLRIARGLMVPLWARRVNVVIKTNPRTIIKRIFPVRLFGFDRSLSLNDEWVTAGGIVSVVVVSDLTWLFSTTAGLILGWARGVGVKAKTGEGVKVSESGWSTGTTGTG